MIEEGQRRKQIAEAEKRRKVWEEDVKCKWEEGRGEREKEDVLALEWGRFRVVGWEGEGGVRIVMGSTCTDVQGK